MSDGKPEPIHQPGTSRGEEQIEKLGREPGREKSGGGSSGAGRPAGKATPRFVTGINPDDRKPIDPNSVYLPPP